MKGSTDPHSSSAALLAAFGAAVLDINRLARDKTLERFHRTALERLQQLVPFQRAWWGRAALIDGVPVEHSAHLFNLEEHYVEDWKSISHDDITVGLVHARPGTAVAVDMQATAGLRWLGARHDIGELLCVIHVDPITRLSDHIALYRTPGGPPFADQEKLLLGQLSAHLAAAVSANQIRTLVALRESLERQALAMAVCDRYGVLHCAERGFVDLLLGAWPGWTGPQLPEETSPQGYRDARLVIDSRQVGDLYLLTARQPSAIEQLSNREGDVALLFSEGKTYKQIARDLGLAERIRADIAAVSPHTEVRLQQMELRNPWDFEEVYGALHDFVSAYPFDTEREDYLVHITTGTHVAQICWFLLTEARYLPARLEIGRAHV